MFLVRLRAVRCLCLIVVRLCHNPAAMGEANKYCRHICARRDAILPPSLMRKCLLGEQQRAVLGPDLHVVLEQKVL